MATTCASLLPTYFPIRPQNNATCGFYGHLSNQICCLFALKHIQGNIFITCLKRHIGKLKNRNNNIPYNMKKELICLLLCCAGTAVAQQNGNYVITGTMTVDSLRYTPERIKKVYLTHEVQGQDVVVDSATVENGRFTFKGKAPGVVAPYRISGFDNGTVQLFLEPGEITVLPFDGRFPVGASVKGTPGNDVLFAYQQSGSGAVDIAKQRMDKVLASLSPEQRNDEKAFYPYQRATYYVNSLSHRTTAMRFVARHLDSPVTLYIIKYDLFRFFTPSTPCPPPCVSIPCIAN